MRWTYPILTPGKGALLLLQSHALVIGLWHLSDPAPIIRQALQHPELRLFEVHFAPEFSTTLQALLYGLERTAHTGIQEDGLKETLLHEMHLLGMK